MKLIRNDKRAETQQKIKKKIRHTSRQKLKALREPL